MTLGEEEILNIHEDGIYRAPDMIELSGGLWITGDPRVIYSLQTAPIQYCGNGGPRLRTGRTPEGLSGTMDSSNTTSTPRLPLSP